MQPGKGEDIHAILGRFSTWSTTQSTNGNGHALKSGSDEVRELAYEEAIRRFGRWPRTNTSTTSRTEPAGETAAPAAPATAPVANKNSAPLKLEPPDAVQAGSAEGRRAGKKSQAKVMKTAAKGNASTAGKTAELPRVPTGDQQSTTPPKNTASLTPVSSTMDADKAAKPVESLAKTKAPTKARRPPGRRGMTVAHSSLAEKGEMAAPAAPNADKLNAATPQAHRRTEFREVLTRSVEAPAAPAEPTVERNTRISIRLSALEESRVRKSAAQAGLTVSAWLRQRALQTEEAALKQDGTAQDVLTELTSPAAARPAEGLRGRLASWFAEARQRFV